MVSVDRKQLTVRDHVPQLALLRGMQLADPANFIEQQHVVSLWAHEAERVYRDTLVSQSAYVTFNKMLRDVCKRYFKDLEQTQVFAEPFLYSALWQGEDKDDQSYNRVTKMDGLKSRLETLMAQSLHEGKTQAALTLFDVSIHHVVKIARLLRLGHALVVGEGGNGKRSLTKLAAWVQGYVVCSLDPSAKYQVCVRVLRSKCVRECEVAV